LAPLRVLLVDWRKMEVRCWEALIDTVDVETQHAALLASYPLIESCDKLVAAVRSYFCIYYSQSLIISSFHVLVSNRAIVKHLKNGSLYLLSIAACRKRRRPT
jgi:hypothetical protein